MKPTIEEILAVIEKDIRLWRFVAKLECLEEGKHIHALELFKTIHFDGSKGLSENQRHRAAWLYNRVREEFPKLGLI